MKRRMGGQRTPSGNGIAPGVGEAKEILTGSALHSSLEDAMLNDDNNTIPAIQKQNEVSTLNPQSTVHL